MIVDLAFATSLLRDNSSGSATPRGPDENPLTVRCRCCVCRRLRRANAVSRTGLSRANPPGSRHTRGPGSRRGRRRAVTSCSCSATATERFQRRDRCGTPAGLAIQATFFMSRCPAGAGCCACADVARSARGHRKRACRPAEASQWTVPGRLYVLDRGLEEGAAPRRHVPSTPLRAGLEAPRFLTFAANGRDLLCQRRRSRRRARHRHRRPHELAATSSSCVQRPPSVRARLWSADNLLLVADAASGAILPYSTYSDARSVGRVPGFSRRVCALAFDAAVQSASQAGQRDRDYLRLAAGAGYVAGEGGSQPAASMPAN